MTIGERIAIASVSESWSPKRLAEEINAAILKANPLHSIRDRKLPDGAYKLYIRSGLIVNREA